MKKRAELQQNKSKCKSKIADIFIELGNVISQSSNGQQRFNWTYDSSGNIYSHEDLANNQKTMYNYDSIGRLIGYKLDYTFYKPSNGAATTGQSIIRYLCNEDNEVYGYTCNGATYLFVKDAFGNIVTMYDAGTGEANYEFDYSAYGEITVSAVEDNSMSQDGIDETLRDVLALVEFLWNCYLDSTLIYKDYSYDSDTGMYYLQSRYYDPEVGRFINCDDTEILKLTQGTLNGANLFAYCNNDPVLNSDPSGRIGTPIQWAFSIIGALIGIPFGKWIARRLGYTKGWKYNAIRVAAVVGGAALGWFAGKVLIKAIVKFVSGQLQKNPQLMIKIVRKYGVKTATNLMRILGVNFLKYMKSNALISFLKVLSNPGLKLPLNFVKFIFDACVYLKLRIEVHSGHAGTAWYSYHMHIGDKRIHLALLKSAYDWLVKMI